MKIVTLDGDTLPLPIPQPGWCDEWVYRGSTGPDELTDALRGATVAITNKVQLRADVLKDLPDLRYICVAATGYDCVDIEACSQQGIAVSNVPGYSTNSVAETAIGNIFALRRHLIEYRRRSFAEWQNAPHFCIQGPLIRDLQGATLGVFGRGATGRAVAQKAEALGMKVLFAEHKQASQVRDGYTAFDQVLAQSDVISLHCPLTPQTHHLFDAATLSAMKPGALLINSARGPLIDEAALAQALRDGTLGGAALDVLSEEPPRSGSPLLETHLDNLIITPHVAWASEASVENLIQGINDNLAGWQAGALKNQVNRT